MHDGVVIAELIGSENQRFIGEGEHEVLIRRYAPDRNGRLSTERFVVIEGNIKLARESYVR